MPQTFYIESDEEIISAIGRLRKSGSQENIFVFPKRALILQSIVNLRLFQREAEKLGKKIIIVTQDDPGRMLAEKAGIETQNYSEDMSQRGSHMELGGETAVPVDAQAPSLDTPLPSPRSENIGSSDFYEPVQIRKPEEALIAQQLVQEAPLVQSQNTPTSVPLRVRNASPERPPSLNSTRYTESIQRPQQQFQPSAPVPMTPPQQQQPLPQSMPQQSSPAPQQYTQAPQQSQAGTEDSRRERLRNFFVNEKPNQTFAPAPSSTPVKNAPQKPAPKQKKAHVAIPGKKVQTALYFLGGLSLLSVVGLVVYLFLPKVDIHIIPHQITQNIDTQLVGYGATPPEEEGAVAVRVVEKQETITLSANATGSSASNSQKARGTVIISNSFSAEPQSLVATTRFETSDGKIFRLADSVTVPGMSGEPGIVEASVIADQAGEEYNIDPTTFTIPGFKGSPKFEKFSAKSVKKMQGGGNSGSSLAVISKTDIEKAEAQAKAQAKQQFLDGYKSELGGKEKILDEALEVTKTGNEALPQANTAAENFEYTGT
ncbi:MAG: hypothetical protein AAB615_00895, partial [Patescibacteria group bacterium]